MGSSPIPVNWTMATYNETLILLDKLAHVDRMLLENMGILFLLREKTKKLKIQNKKQSSIKDFFQGYQFS